MLQDEADEALMAKYQGGEVRAFEILMTRHRRPIYNFILRYVGNAPIAEELLQETFLRVVRSASRYQPKAKFTTWLYTIARNLCTDQARRAVHRRTRSLDANFGAGDDSGTLLDVLPNDQIGADRESASTEIRKKLEEALSRLAEDQREVFLMREFHGMPFKEIASVVGASENTVKSRMRYALEKLRIELAEFKELSKETF